MQDTYKTPMAALLDLKGFVGSVLPSLVPDGDAHLKDQRMGRQVLESISAGHRRCALMQCFSTPGVYR